MKYMLLCIALSLLGLSWGFSFQIHGATRLPRKIVKENSILRKILLRKKNRNDPLEIYKVVPFVINFVLFFVVLLVYLSYAILYTLPIGVAIGNFLESIVCQFITLGWWLLVILYICFISVI